MKTKPFYGWTVLGALFVIYMASNGIMQNTWPAILRAVATEFKIDNEKATFLPGLTFLIMAVLLPFAGFLATKVSPKKMIICGVLFFIACVAYFKFVTDYNSLMIYYILFPIGLSLAGLLSSMIIINNWFYKYKGVAVGIFLNASSIGAAIFNPIAGSLIKEYGWRDTSLILGIIVVLMVTIPIIFIFNTPALKNTYPDGNDKRTVFNTNQNDNPSALSLVKSRNFWLLILITGILWFVITGFIFNQQFYLKQLNLDEKKSGLITGLFFLCSLIGKIVFGWLSDRYDKKSILLFSVFNLILGVILLRFSIEDNRLIVVTAIAMGIGYSGCFTMIQLIIAHLYTGNTYSKVLGIMTMIDTFAAFFGIVLTGKWAKELGGYSFPFEVYIYLTIAALLATLLLKKEYKTLHD
jgi:MFS transporter, OFA family, oxalate/formate antiporter